tara:strand:+ start:309 stop:605 length:297 start_codon:yes stop_codon:yes gene_type:complete
VNKASPRAQTYSATEFAYLAASGSDIDLVTTRPAYAPATGANDMLLPRQIQVIAAGDLAVEDVNGVTMTVPAATAGSVFSIQPRKLLAATTANVVVLW